MSEIALKAISITIGVFFVFFGTLNLAPLFSEELYRSVRKNFIRTYQSFPLSWLTGWSPDPHVVRRVHGTIEVVCGLILASCTGVIQDLGNIILLSLMIFQLFFIWYVSDGLKEASNPIVLCLLLTCRLIIRIQMFQKPDNDQSEENFVKDDIRRRVISLQQELNQMKKLEKDVEIRMKNTNPFKKVK